ncbi:MAG: DUF4276 family protein, partial [Caldilineaceae bacterium]|nr:DUF4276 family protein [Caldilineaceae bacterium]
ITQAQAAAEAICADVVPVIPIHMTEAWMLVDHEVLLDVIGTTMQPHQLPRLSAQQIEDIADPKARLVETMQTALASRPKRVRRQRSSSELYEPLGRRIALARLAQLPSYQRFVDDLRQALARLRLIG